MADDSKSERSKATNAPEADESSRALLEHAALELLGERGVLGGLNLREVAERAGVNRALVYHHFGSREALLRSALRRDVDLRIRKISECLPLPFSARIRQLLRTLVQQQESVRLAMLLVLDGNEAVRLAPLHDAWMDSFYNDQKNGEIEEELDLEALLVLVSALSYGYTLLREDFAEEFDISSVELDWRIDALLEKLLESGIATGKGADKTSSGGLRS